MQCNAGGDCHTCIQLTVKALCICLIVHTCDGNGEAIYVGWLQETYWVEGKLLKCLRSQLLPQAQMN